MDDLTVTDEDQRRYELCQTISPDHPALKRTSDMLTHTLEDGKQAVSHHKEFPQLLFMVYQEAFRRHLTVKM